jgi:hypothetical protein
MVLAVCIKLPRVIRTHEMAALHRAPMAEVCAQVRAERMKHSNSTICASESNHLSSAAGDGEYLALLELAGAAHTVPPVRVRLWKLPCNAMIN